MKKLKFRQWDIEEYNHIIDENHFWILNNVDIDKVEQYTGLEDKEGEEIYEGDILMELFGDDDIVIFKIIWNDLYDAGYNEIASLDECCIMYDIRLNRSYCRMKVIGNIHENPEMETRRYWTKKRLKELLAKEKKDELLKSTNENQISSKEVKQLEN